MKIGEIIRKYRESHGMSMGAFALQTGLSKTYISMLEKNFNNSTGKSVTPSGATLKACAQAMNIPLKQLLKEIDEDQLASIKNAVNQELFSSATEQDLITWMSSLLTPEGKEKLEHYIEDLISNPKNIDPNEVVRALLVNNLTPEAKEKRAKIAKELRILNNMEKSVTRDALKTVKRQQK